jgi:hypothetical protein
MKLPSITQHVQDVAQPTPSQHPSNNKHAADRTRLWSRCLRRHTGRIDSTHWPKAGWQCATGTHWPKAGWQCATGTHWPKAGWQCATARGRSAWTRPKILILAEYVRALHFQGSLFLALVKTPRACINRILRFFAARPFECRVARVVLFDGCRGEGGYASDSSGNTKRLGCIGGVLLDAAWNTRANVRTWPQSPPYLQGYPCCASHTMQCHHLIRSHLYLHHRKVNATQHGIRMYKCDSRLNKM